MVKVYMLWYFFVEGQLMEVKVVVPYQLKKLHEMRKAVEPIHVVIGTKYISI